MQNMWFFQKSAILREYVIFMWSHKIPTSSYDERKESSVKIRNSKKELIMYLLFCLGSYIEKSAGKAPERSFYKLSFPLLGKMVMWKGGLVFLITRDYSSNRYFENYSLLE